MGNTAGRRSREINLHCCEADVPDVPDDKLMECNQVSGFALSGRLSDGSAAPFTDPGSFLHR